jgi:hypothetical protein
MSVWHSKVIIPRILIYFETVCSWFNTKTPGRNTSKEETMAPLAAVYFRGFWAMLLAMVFMGFVFGGTAAAQDDPVSGSEPAVGAPVEKKGLANILRGIDRVIERGVHHADSALGLVERVRGIREGESLEGTNSNYTGDSGEDYDSSGETWDSSSAYPGDSGEDYDSSGETWDSSSDELDSSYDSPEQQSILDISGTWQTIYGAQYYFTQNGSSFTVVGYGDQMEGHGIIEGNILTTKVKFHNKPTEHEVAWTIVQSDGNYASRIRFHNGVVIFH